MKYHLLKLTEIPDCCAVCGWYRIDEYSSACTKGAECCEDFYTEVEMFGVCGDFQRIENWKDEWEGVLWEPHCERTCEGCEWAERE